MANLIGALRVSLSADTAQFDAGMKRAQRTAATSSSAITKSLGTLKAGLAGLASGLSIGLLSNVIKGALDYASSLGEVSQQLGVSTRDLQVFRYAAGQLGVSQEEVDKGLGKLTITLGQVAAGAKAPTKALEAIGISAKDLAGVDTGTAFRMIADGLAQVTDRAQRAAIEVALFGKTGAKLDTMLSGGSGALNELASAADRLGIVLSDEQIQKADETADKLAAVQTVLSAKIAGVVADNSTAVLDFANSLAEMANTILTLGNAMGQLAANAPAWAKTLAQAAGRALNPLGNFLAAAGQVTSGKGDGVARDYGVAGSSVSVKLKPAAAPTGGGRSVGNFLAGGGGGKKRGGGDGGAAKAERARLDAIRDAYRFDEDLRRANIDVLRAQESLSTDYSERATLQVQMLDLERKGYQDELANDVAMGERTAAQSAQLLALYDSADALKRRAIVDDEQAKRAEDFNALAAVDYGNRRDLLEQQASLAETASERRTIELRILDLALQEARDRQARLERESTDQQAIEEGRRNLAGLEGRQAGAREGVMRGTRGPLEEYLAGVPDTAAKMEEAIQAVKVNAIDGLVQGLSDAATGAQKLGDVFSNVAKQIIADLIKIYIQKAIVGAISNAISGFSGGTVAAPSAAGNAATSSGSFTGPRFATGGGFTILGRKGTDRNIMSLNGLPIARVSHGERVNISNDNANAQGGGASRVQVIPSPYFDVVVDRRAAQVAAPMAERAAMVGGAVGQQATMRQRRRAIP